MTEPKDRGKRKFVLTVDGTKGLTIEELTRAVTRAVSQINSGRQQIEAGFVRRSDGRIIGLYGWSDQ